jgi:hypothetical protein
VHCELASCVTLLNGNEYIKWEIFKHNDDIFMLREACQNGHGNENIGTDSFAGNGSIVSHIQFSLVAT